MKCPTHLRLPPYSRHFRSLLRSCTRRSSAPSLAAGKQLHAVILTSGIVPSPNTFLLNALLHVYAQCGVVSYAQYLFDQIPQSHKDTADWTALLNCLAQQRVHAAHAFRLFNVMRKGGVLIDDVVSVCVLSLCARMGELVMGRQIHGYLMKLGFGQSIKAFNAVMNIYVKCGAVSDARQVFGEMSKRNVVSWSIMLDGVMKSDGVEEGRLVFDTMPERNEVAWTIMIAGYVGCGFSKEGFLLLNEMISGFGLSLNYVSLCSILSACAQSGDVVMGKWVHAHALKAVGREMDIMVGTALINMYAKSGRIRMAYGVFEYLPRRNVVAWNTMLGALAMFGGGNTILDMLPEMLKEVKPDDLTFIAVLSACSHSGLVHEGRRIFHSLESDYCITPKVEHYACMVDLLGRAGHLQEAEILIKSMPMPPNEVVLGSLLGACHFHGKLQLGEQVLQELVHMYPHNTECHILLSNMHALAGNMDNVSSIRQVLKSKGIRKIPGMSYIYVGGQVHQFSAGDKSHPKTQDLYEMLDDMIRRLRLAGYVPNTTCQVFSGCDGRDYNAEEKEEKEQALFSHSEKLAVCFGLISTRPGSSLYIFKNLRICQDCHSALKIVSDIYGREIVVRDRNRFHCFKNGSCSCSDYW
ncbi:hypothetical protein K2173_014302 [Erythroxylum novogranatense]|uniref:DYW domain-containing protein n=1 Tax=Erythroxylum novogranatense TaxID=1862640 RepID=A0AAV8SDW5_9ROSI|nr:hypothetical protein K2173_014302 [Erythroxylum novogranatense]